MHVHVRCALRDDMVTNKTDDMYDFSDLQITGECDNCPAPDDFKSFFLAWSHIVRAPPGAYICIDIFGLHKCNIYVYAIHVCTFANTCRFSSVAG